MSIMDYMETQEYLYTIDDICTFMNDQECRKIVSKCLEENREPRDEEKIVIMNAVMKFLIRLFPMNIKIEKWNGKLVVRCLDTGRVIEMRYDTVRMFIKDKCSDLCKNPFAFMNFTQLLAKYIGFRLYKAKLIELKKELRDKLKMIFRENPWRYEKVINDVLSDFELFLEGELYQACEAIYNIIRYIEAEIWSQTSKLKINKD